MSVKAPDLTGRLAALSDDARQEIAAALGTAAALVGAEVRQTLGRVSPSAPEAPPADPAGAIAASIVTSVDAEALTASIAVEAPQARDLEYGTRRMAARPFLRPAVTASQGEARAILRDALARAIAKTGDST